MKRDLVTSRKPGLVASVVFLSLLSGPPPLRFRDPGASLAYVVDWSVALNVLVWTIGALWISNEAVRRLILREPLPRLHKLEAFMDVFIISLSLSVISSPSPLLSAYRVVQLAILVMFARVWIAKYSVASAMRLMQVGYGLLGLVIAGVAFYAPDLVFGGRRLGGGLITNAAYVSTLGLVLALSIRKERNLVRDLVFVPVYVWMLFVSQTRAAYLALCLVLALAIVKLPKPRLLAWVAYAVILLAVLGGMTGWTGMAWARLLRETESLRTLSDRLPLWSYLIDETLKRSPWTGSGFYANRSVALEFNPGLGTSHSAFVEVVTGGGILSAVTFALVLAQLMTLSIRTLSRMDRRGPVFAISALLVAVLTIGFVSTDMIIASPTGFAFFFLVSSVAEVERRLGVTV